MMVGKSTGGNYLLDTRVVVSVLVVILVVCILVLVVILVLVLVVNGGKEEKWSLLRTHVQATPCRLSLQ
jgi:hypothetical protein